MKLAEKIQILRKNNGYSQEDLAEKLGVSRQAIGKWEGGQATPDIENLVCLSDLFKVTVDRLVKDDDDCNTQLNVGISCKKDVLIAFLMRAKKACYAGNGPVVPSSRPMSHDLRFEEDVYLYIDTYLGGECFSGEEAVWYSGVPVWTMNYCGRVTGDNFSGDFLKEALVLVPANEPYRGPGIYQNGLYSYHCKVDGNFEWYQGYEEIYYDGVKIYECMFHGGIVK